ncbi:hypothetical protein [Mucilaginibacter sp.]|jgi:glucose-6-phosphate 1-dehydrogenase|uniref:hypothetical protein n=1 Tax=Mucilaginibacter sp. TaxID=1882438 RepID=UPI003565D7A3
MHQASSIITIRFKDAPQQIPASASENRQENRLVISIQPEMSRFQLLAKRELI